MRLKSFGCSFIYGTDLADSGAGQTYATPSKLTWPALLAQRLDMPYDCYARPGMGNFAIMDYVLRQACTGSHGDIYVIGLTFMERVDYLNSTDPRQRWQSFNIGSDNSLAEYYYKNLHSEYQDKLENLIRAKTIIDVLRSRHVPFIITAMDHVMFDQAYHCNPGIIELQEFVQPWITWFDGKNFLQWSQQQGHAISATAHPLETAHVAAADMMWPVIQGVLASGK